MNRQKSFISIAVAVLTLFFYFSVPVYAISDDQSAAIQSFLDEVCQKSGVPGMSVSVLYKGDTFFISSGYANKEEKIPVNENTIFELASVSKAFTGVGVLLLEKQGLLSMNDPIDKFLPWLSLRYNGELVDMSSITLNNLLHHNSGIASGEHFMNIPEGNSPDMLQKTVETLTDTELVFSPGEQYQYGTINYDVLALVIESVSGQRFEDYMKQNVFEPLGLHSTYLYLDEAKATGNMAQGYRTSFFITTPYDAPEYGGNKAAGYVISSSYDMARWMGIHLGTVTDIPEMFRTVIAKSHKGNLSNPTGDDMYYAAGWFVNGDRTVINHSGSNPTFKTNVFIFPDEQVGICLLANGSNTNIDIIANIKDILDGNLSQSYKLGGWLQPVDVILSCVTIIAGLLAVVFLILGVRRKVLSGKSQITKKRLMLTGVWLVITVAVGIFAYTFPQLFFVANWHYMFIWMPYSIPIAWVVLFLLSGCITWFVFARRKQA